MNWLYVYATTLLSKQEFIFYMIVNDIKSYRTQSQSFLKTFLYFLNLIITYFAFKKTSFKSSFIVDITI